MSVYCLVHDYSFFITSRRKPPFDGSGCDGSLAAGCASSVGLFLTECDVDLVLVELLELYEPLELSDLRVERDLRFFLLCLGFDMTV